MIMARMKRRQRVKEYWKTMMRSLQLKMSRGGANISKVISRARGDNWRRGRERKKQ